MKTILMKLGLKKKFPFLLVETLLFIFYFLMMSILTVNATTRPGYDLTGEEPTTTFSTTSLEITSSTPIAKLVDVEGDGDLDIYIINGSFGVFMQQDHLLLNDGTGVYTYNMEAAKNTSKAGRSGKTVSVRIEDTDNDGDQDVVIQGQNKNKVLVNDGNGIFLEASDF